MKNNDRTYVFCVESIWKDCLSQNQIKEKIMKIPQEKEIMKKIALNCRFTTTKCGTYAMSNKYSDGWVLVREANELLAQIVFKTVSEILLEKELMHLSHKVIRALTVGAFKCKNKKLQVAVRVAAFEDCTYVDGGNRIVKITADAITRLKTTKKAIFHQSEHQLQFPKLAKSGDIKILKEILGLDDKSWHKILFFMISSLMPKSAKPILTFCGSPGSGKTTIAKIIKFILDPETSGVMAMPNRTRDLMLAACKSHILLIDNIGKISSRQEDAFCMFATGGGMRERTLYTNSMVSHLEFSAGLIITSVGSFTTRPDLLARMIIVETEDLKKPKESLKILEEVKENLGKIQRGLFNIIQAIHKNTDCPAIESKVRMQDALNYVSRGEEYMGYKHGFFAKKLSVWDSQTRKSIAFNSTLVGLIYDSMMSSCFGARKPGKYFKEATPTKMLEWLLEDATSTQMKDKDMPKSPSGLGKMLSHLKPSLKMLGIKVFSTHTGKQRLIKFSFTKKIRKTVVAMVKDRRTNFARLDSEFYGS